MALYKRSETVRDFNGVVVSKASVRVVTGTTYSDQAPLASLFQDQAGLIPLSNPVTADAAGQYGYWAEAGFYAEKVSRSGYYSETNNDLYIGAIPGAQGPAGAAGPAGPQGASGAQGPAGPPDTTLRSDLADVTNSALGAGLSGFNAALAYAAGTVGKFLKDLGSSIGASLIGYLALFTGAVATTQQEVNQRIVHAKDFGAKFDGVTDDLAAINAATAYAHSLALSTLVLPYDNYRRGGCVVKLPPGKAVVSGTVNFYDDVVIEGQGKHSTIISSAYDGPIFRNALTNYDMFGAGVRRLTIEGDRTKTSQIGLAVLRDWWGDYSDLMVVNCGGTGIRMYQCINSKLDGTETLLNVGPGLWISEGRNSWADATTNNLPSNACVFNNCHLGFNDGAGIKATGLVNGCIWNGGSAEYNYRSSQGGGNTGYNIEWLASSTVPSELNDLWTEGGCQAHLYLNATSGSPLRMNKWHHFGNGAAGNVDRAAIVNVGALYLSGAFGHGASYKSIGGSIAPFRVNKSGPGVINARDIYGSTITNGYFCEDTANATTGLTNYFYSDNLIHRTGPVLHYADFGQTTTDYYQAGDANPWLSLVNFYKGLSFGPGGAGALDTTIQRTAANTLGMASGDFFDQGSAWNGNHVLMGAFHLWVDGAGKLRIKSGAPTSDTDGTVVGTQA